MRQIFGKTLLVALMVSHISCKNAQCQPSSHGSIEANEEELPIRPSTAYLASYRDAAQLLPALAGSS